ncbi:DENN domain-containing protein 3-like [Amphiura filiformis]|uniref:DENN domain-containing protein 3-like n=1 Tax=Amphiura filiformis TaxID=82378 RepID=UPI003B21C922
MPGGGGLCLVECPSSTTTVRQTDSDESNDKLLCWVPTCIVLISQQPYFTLLKECLSTLIPQLKDKPYTLFHVLKEFTLQLTMVPIPPAGPVSINFLLGEVLTVHPPEHPDKPVVDITLHLPFLLFSVDQILQIVACILTQQRIVFLSHDFALITPIIECFMMYILPFKWPFVYVPVVWNAMLDLLEAPGCYIMGCSSAHRLRIAQIEGLVMVDLDRGQVQVCDTVKALPSIPTRAAEDFKEKFQQIRTGCFDIAMLSRPVAASFEAEKARREKLQRAFQRDITDLFLELLVIVFRDTSEYINTELRVFKQEDFLSSRAKEDREFYKQVLHTELFKQFKEDRLDQKKDYYTQMEKRSHRLSVIGGGSSGELSRLRKTSSLVSNPAEPKVMTRKSSVNDLSKSLPSTQKSVNFMMPPFRLPLSTPQTYYEECIDQLGYNIQSVKTPTVKASYLFLRGMFKIGCGRPLDGLDDFHSLHTTDLSIFPFRAVEQVIDALSIPDKEHLHKQDFYKKAEILRKISQRRKRPQLSQTPVLHPEDLPQEGVIEQSEFIKHMQYTEIAIDLDVIERVFNALTAAQGYLDTETFIYFHDAWKESEAEADEIPTCVFDHLLKNCETVLKLSSLIRSDFGTGRLVLTDKGILFFLIEGSNEYKEVILLRNIDKLEKFDSIYLVLQSAPALRIFSKRESDPPFVANLKAERNCWFTLITEMWAGRNISDAQKDPQVVQQAARNVLLLDAVIRSAENPGATHARHLDAAAWQLCHFTRLKSEGMAKVTPETSSVLVHKFNPSSNEAQRTTVEAMIYTPGKIGSDDDNHPRLWCAMGSGRVKVFNGSNFVLEAEIDEAKDRVCCLQLVRGDQVWAGSFDTTIYIIDVVSYTANKQLVEHDDIVSDITTDEDSSMAYTASLNGQVNVWDTQSLVLKNTINLDNTDKLVSIKYYKGNIWCCTKDDIRLVDLEGEELRRLQHIDAQGVPQLIEAFIIAHDMVWTGCGRQGVVACWDVNTLSKKKEMKVNCRGISRLVEVKGRIWAGSKQGKIHRFDCKTGKYMNELSAHDDAVRALCKAEDRYVITGAGSRDGKVAVWRAGAMRF